MSGISSKHLSATQLQALERLGDIYLPGTEKMPSFTASGSLAQIDVVLEGVHEDDLTGLGWLLLILRWMPALLLRLMLKAVDRHHRFPPPFAGILRLLNLGLKGVVMSLYYSGLAQGETRSGVHEAMQFELHCEPD